MAKYDVSKLFKTVSPGLPKCDSGDDVYYAYDVVASRDHGVPNDQHKIAVKTGLQRQLIEFKKSNCFMVFSL
ncbi:hypothetical protein [Methylobacter svalbardensis]|uniref:hypothetical protein n=1 Tax=Methylobacter svalbardensis TaxID=3080016 RepID=UPI0030ED937E